MFLHERLRRNPQGDRPEVAAGTYVDPAATVIGRVRLGERVLVAPGAVIRADESGPAGAVAPVVIGDECNVQDNVVIHALGGTTVEIGARSSLTHGCVVHGPAHLGAGCFVGFNAVVFRAELGEGVMVGHGALVAGMCLPAGTLVPPGARVTSEEDAAGLGQVGQAEREFMAEVVETNLHLAEGYAGLA